MNRYLYSNSLQPFSTTFMGESEVYVDLKNTLLYGHHRLVAAQDKAIEILRARMKEAGANYMVWEAKPGATPYESRTYWSAKFYRRQVYE